MEGPGQAGQTDEREWRGLAGGQQAVRHGIRDDPEAKAITTNNKSQKDREAGST